MKAPTQQLYADLDPRFYLETLEEKMTRKLKIAGADDEYIEHWHKNNEETVKGLQNWLNGLPF